jgi:hypothetical protein
MIGFIGRLDQQKGADLVLQCGPELLQENVQLICLGTGDQGLEVCCSPPVRSDQAVPTPTHHWGCNDVYGGIVTALYDGSE